MNIHIYTFAICTSLLHTFQACSHARGTKMVEIFLRKSKYLVLEVLLSSIPN